MDTVGPTQEYNHIKGKCEHDSVKGGNRADLATRRANAGTPTEWRAKEGEKLAREAVCHNEQVRVGCRSIRVVIAKEVFNRICDLLPDPSWIRGPRGEAKYLSILKTDLWQNAGIA